MHALGSLGLAQIVKHGTTPVWSGVAEREAHEQVQTLLYNRFHNGSGEPL